MSEKIKILFGICLTIIILSCIGTYQYYHIQDRQLMANNVTDAIEKGIDPLSVRCAYASEIDAVCVAYAYTSKTPDFKPAPIKK
jgi:hypothetical protein